MTSFCSSLITEIAKYLSPNDQEAYACTSHEHRKAVSLGTTTLCYLEQHVRFNNQWLPRVHAHTLDLTGSTISRALCITTLFPNLTTVSLARSKGDISLSHLPNTVTALDLTGFNLDEADILNLATRTNLTALRLSSCILPGGVRSLDLGALVNLKTLAISNLTGIAVTFNSTVRELAVSHRPDADLSYLRFLTHLRELRAAHTPLDDALLEATMETNPSLTSLELDSTQVSIGKLLSLLRQGKLLFSNSPQMTNLRELLKYERAEEYLAGHTNAELLPVSIEVSDLPSFNHPLDCPASDLIFAGMYLNLPHNLRHAVDVIKTSWRATPKQLRALIRYQSLDREQKRLVKHCLYGLSHRGLTTEREMDSWAEGNLYLDPHLFSDAVFLVTLPDAFTEAMQACFHTLTGKCTVHRAHFLQHPEHYLVAARAATLPPEKRPSLLTPLEDLSLALNNLGA